MGNSVIFHLAIPIDNIFIAKQFYADSLGCVAGRENNTAIIFNFFGTQLVGHITQDKLAKQSGIYPRHFGLILSTKEDWTQICDRAKKYNLTFYQQPKLRFPQQPLEHNTFFLEDPFHNFLEFKYYRHSDIIFGGKEWNLIGDSKDRPN